ncbi:MAG: hypothetical protein QM831_32380 [Kofleriaceae bacterium]
MTKAPLLLILLSSTSFAVPRPGGGRIGANHHIGDDSFIAKYGHNVDVHANEQERMHLHLQYVYDWLAARPATKPELAGKRKEILAHFADYIAKNTTPKNAHVPWRTPVFIDDEGTICAVGYLIQQTTNEQLPKKIASEHRYDFIEDIAAQMPEVKNWVEESGFTLDEIAHIQPAYEEPSVKTWRTWDLAKHVPKDGQYDKLDSHGVFKHAQMEGEWTATMSDNDESVARVVGRGTMKHGAGMWTSFYDTGETFARGRYVHNVAQGTWQLFHQSGNLAAEGRFDGGERVGKWSFFYDTPAKTPLAIGKFDHKGKVVGKWQHFAENGELVATTWNETPSQWHDTDWEVDGGEGFMIDVTAKPGGIKHARHQGTVNSGGQVLDMYAFDGERVYEQQSYDATTMWDENGFRLTHDDEDGQWWTADCHWNDKRKAYAHEGDLVPLHGALYTDSRKRANPTHEGVGGSDGHDDGPKCGVQFKVDAARAKKLDALMVARNEVRAVTPQFIRSAVLRDSVPEEDLSDSDRANLAKASDLARVLEENMSQYVEWPHIDGRFVELFKRMAGRKTQNWAGGDPEGES